MHLGFESAIFENYSEHEQGVHLEQLSELLDQYPEILALIEQDIVDNSLKPVGRYGLTVENVFRSLLLNRN